MEKIEEIYDWLHKTCPSKKTFEDLLVDMKKKFIELEVPHITTNNRPSAIWILALNFLTHNRREIKSIMGNGDATIVVYK